MAISEGDIVLCTVDRIVGTTVFVHIQDSGEGSIVFSEVAPGRIRNIRDYVVPKKKIVCKVLRVSSDGRVDLSLRRVSLKEQKEIFEIEKLQKSYESIIKSVAGVKTPEILVEIRKKESLYDFLQRAKEDPKDLEKAVGKEGAKKVLEILNTQQKQKKSVIKKDILLTTNKPNGLEIIKNLLSNIKGAEIRYIAGGKYSLKAESDDVKKADSELRIVLEELEKKARKGGAEFSIVKK